MTGRDFGALDEIELLCKKYDKNNDGHFSPAEVKAIVHDLDKQHEMNRGLKQTICLVVAIAVA